MNIFFSKNRTSYNLTTKIISIILSFVIFFSAFPLITLADEVDEAVVEDIAVEDIEPTIVQELEEERTENTKQFLMSDHTVKAIMYSEPVHYEEDGKWYDIDNSLEYEKETSKNDFNGYKTASGSFDVKFAQTASSSKLITVSQDDYSLSWNLLNKTKIISHFNTIKIENKKISEDTTEIESCVADASQTVRYDNIVSNTDLEYIVNGNGLKENIIIKKPADEYTYSFEINANNLTLSLQKDNSIIAADSETEECIFTIPTMFMIDSTGQYSDKITVSLKQTDENTYVLIVSADKDWINSEDRIFPVTIDPQITTKQLKKEISSTYVESGFPTKNHSAEPHLEVGRDSSGHGKLRSYIKFTLPQLGKGDMVVDATLNLVQNYVDYYASSTPDTQINAYKVTDPWEQGNVTWNNQPSSDSTILDYDHLKKSEKTKPAQKSWNITKVVKEWYEGKSANNGIILKSASEGASSMVDSCIYSWFYTAPGSVSEAYPIIVITYRNNKGLEPYWTYTSASAGSAGTAHINDYSGNLVFSRTDYTSSGLRMPVSVEHVYNGYMAGTKYSKTKPYVGMGWKLNIQQTVSKTSIADYPYVYEDGDGTEHYFYKKTANGKTQYLDEDGLNLELQIVDSGYKITDDKDNVLVFNSSGFLTSILDANRNLIEIEFDSSDKTMIRRVIDGSGHIIEFLENVNGSGYLQWMKDPAGRKIHYMIDAGRLVAVTNPDGTKDEFTYDSQHSLTSAKSSTGYSLNFTYTDSSKGKRVSAIQEKAGSANGQKITFDRSKYNTTVIRTSGPDDIFETSDDINTTYQFDNFGRTISTQSKSTSADLGAEVYNYTSAQVNSSASNIKSLNRVSSTASFGKNIINLVKNSNAESKSDWALARWVDDCTATFGTTTAQKYMGYSSFKLTSTAVTGDGRARIYQNFTTTDIKPGSTYTLSAYVKTDNITKVNNYAYGACVSLYAECADSANSRTVYSEYLQGTTDTFLDNGWRRISVTLTLPSDIKTLRANLAIRNATGTAYFDAIQLEESSVANVYNMIENCSLERVTNDIPNGWRQSGMTLSNLADGTSTVARNGKASFRMKGDATVSKQLVQDINVSGTEDDTYIVSAWAKAQAVPASASSRKFLIAIRVMYSDGTEVWKTPALFNYTISDWQYTAQTFTLSDGTSANKTPTKISIYLTYHNQANWAYFDTVQLIKDVSASYTYDADGNVISVAANAEQKSKMEYSNSNLIKSTDPKGYSYTYTYDSHKNVTQAKSQNGVKYNYTYNAVGEPTALNITSSGATTAINSTVSYTLEDKSKKIRAGAYVASTADQDGYNTTYSYDNLKGTIASIKDAKGTITEYTYDENNDALTSVTSNGTTNTYAYLNRRLASIVHNGTTYGFTYDSFGNVSKTTAGNYTLSTNTYAANNGKLSKVTYGNGDYQSYQYNAYGQVTSLSKNGSVKYKWLYDASAKPIEHQDNENKLNYVYTYDTTGRLVRENVYQRGAAASADARIFSAEQSYDANNNVSKIIQYANGQRFAQKYIYGKDNLPEQYMLSATRTQTYSYDALNRFNKMVLSTDNPVAVNYIYWLSDRNTDSSDYYRTTKIVRELIGTTAYSYQYDKLGNITVIREGQRDGDTNNGKGMADKVSYEYDKLSQLTRENNKYLNQTIKYTYDEGGNLTEKKIYPYTTGSLSGVTATSTKAYSYGNSTWKDLLTSYGGQTITYDGIGNPLSYLGYTLSWNGRQLTKLSGKGVTASYKYDADGLRSYKKVGSVESTYQYLGDKLVYEKRGDIELSFGYNSFGDLAHIKYTTGGTTYYHYVICNSRGDVENIYNGVGNLIAHYTYDSWGNVISVTNASGKAITDPTHIGNVNPIRYRGYYYDTETGYYYLQSRYYNPQVGRFLNADGYVQTGQGILSNNMFAYCGNNPVNRMDPTGHFWSEVGNWLKAIVKKVVNGVESFLTPSNVYGSTVGVLSISTNTLALSLENAIKTAVRPSNIGLGTFAKQCASELESVSKFSRTSSRILTALSYVAITIDVGVGISENISNGAPTGKIISDAFVDIAFTGGSIWAAGAIGGYIGTYVGFTVPGIGNIVGAAAGFVAGIAIYAFTDMIYFNNTDNTMRQWAKEGFGGLW